MEHRGISVSLIKRVSLCMISYSLGYFQCSISWIVLAFILDVIRDKKAKRRLFKRDFVRNFSFSDEKAVISSIPNLPAWVCFPDIERVEWLNKIIKQLWPKINNYVHDFIKESLETKLNKKIGKYGLSGLEFKKFIVGSVAGVPIIRPRVLPFGYRSQGRNMEVLFPKSDENFEFLFCEIDKMKPFRIGGVVVFENVSEKEIVLDVDIIYAGDCDITLKFSKIRGGIKDFQLYGRLRIILKPLLDTLPLAGGIQLFFLNPPDIDFTLDGMAGVLEFPLLNELLKKLILDTIYSAIVLPNKFPILLTKKVSKEHIKVPSPKGVLRVHVVQARYLMKRDLTFSGHLTSDPYAILNVGDQEYKTPVREHTARPKWDFWCEFIIEEINGVYLFISIWDDDTIQEDEPLGRAKILISKLVEKQTADMWFNLKEVKHGQIQLRTTWMTLSTNYEDLKSTLYEMEQLQVPTLTSSLLTVYVDSASDLVSSNNSNNLETYVKINIGNQEKNTKTYKKPNDPVWEEGFIFLAQNPEESTITFKVLNDKEEKDIGEFTFSINSLFDEEDFRKERQTFRLSECETNGRIILSLTLRILTNASFNGREAHSNNSEEYSTDDNGLKFDNLKDLSELSSLSRTSSISSGSSHGSIKSDILSPGKIKLTLRYSVQRQRLIVVVHHLEELHFDEIKGLYVKLYLLPERHKDTKRKTKVLRTSKNPVFDETFEFVISQDELNRKHLEVSVCEEGIIKNEAIEKVVIDLDKLSLVLPHTRLFRLFKKSHES